MGRNPDDIGLNARMAAFVHRERQEGRPVNTQKVYDPRIREFKEFCKYVYPTDEYRYNINTEKVYRFMFYTAMREKRNTGGTNKHRSESTFDPHDYDRIYAALRENENDRHQNRRIHYLSPKNPIGTKAFTQYKSVLRSIHAEQINLGVCRPDGWEYIWTEDLKELHRHVNQRIPKLQKANYVEKIDGEFAPYAIVERYEDIENLMWEDSQNANGYKSISAKLRHRACTLYLTTGILRSESIHKRDLSDFFSLRIPQLDKDIHSPWLLLMTIPDGKTSFGKKQFGRATRHKLVQLCACGAIAMYLNYRLFLTGEFKDMTVDQWLDNSYWFDVKFLVNVNKRKKPDEIQDYKTEMKSDSYSKHIKSVLHRLNLPTNKLLHLGRNAGTKALDLMEVSSEDIRRMGQWNNSVVDNSYSSKLPMTAIRSLAGFNSANGAYFNTRTTVMPSQELLDATPFGFAFKMIDQVNAEDPHGSHRTAFQMLRFFMDMAVIFLQDSAAMMVQFPARSNHPMFHEIPLFSSDEFQVSMMTPLFNLNIVALLMEKSIIFRHSENKCESLLKMSDVLLMQT
jgi:hypothetical protein